LQSVIVPYLWVRRERQLPLDESQEMIRALRSEEGTVSAIVEDDEDPNQETGRGDGDRERQPIGDVQRPNHQAGEGQVRDERVDDLPDALSQHRLLVLGNRLLPGQHLGWRSLTVLGASGA